MEKLIHYMNIAFNIAPHEWPRVIFSWTLKLLAHSGMLMGTTVLTALFVEKYHTGNLPFLYITSALFVVAGSLVFSFFMERITKKFEIILITLCAALLLYVAPLFASHTFVFYTMIFTALSIFVTQLNILITLFIEELFSPLESERTFPIIESSEPIGGILAGVILTVGVTYFHFSALEMLSFVGLFLFLIIPFLLISIKLTNNIPKLERATEKQEISRFEKTKKGLRHIRSMPFLKGMVLVVFLQFAFVNLVEYQYTTILEQNINQNTHAEASVAEDHSQASALTHGLAFWHVMFSLLAFLTQMITASRIHTKFGIIKSMQLHPFFNIFSSFWIIIQFAFNPVIVARGIFEITTIMHRTAYHSSFYVLKKSIREHVKEFLEGIIRPLGTIVGTIFLFAIVHFSPDAYQHQILSVFMFLIMVAMLLFLGKMRKQYTLIAKKNLDAQTSNVEKMEAIEILAQKGHDEVSIILGKNIHDKQHVHVQCKILEILGTIQDVNSIPDILKMLHSEEKEVQIKSAEALAQFKNLGKHFFSQSFAKHRVLTSLENLFVQSRSKQIKSAVIRVFQNINNADIIPFLLKILENKDPELVADAIFVCGLFNDINSAHYLEKYLLSDHPRMKSSAIISLWNFPQYRLKALIQLTQMLSSTDDEVKISGIYTLGEIKAVQEIPRLKKFLQSDNEKIQCHAAIALAKMEDIHAAHLIVNFILHEDKELSKISQKLLNRLPENIKKFIKNLLLHRITHKMQKLLEQHKHKTLETIPTSVLESLKHYYAMLEETKEVLQIEEELEMRKTQK